MGIAVHVTDATFSKEVLQSPVLTIADFWAEWCAPCKRLAPILDQIATEYADRLKITKLDVDTNPLTPPQYNITGIPALLIFKQGKLVDTIVGFLPKDKLLQKLAPHL